jgi:hypothetical protein
MDFSLVHFYVRALAMGLKERFGCFFLAVGMATFLLFAFPIVQAFRKDPGTVPVEWIGVALIALLAIGAGWKLYRSARRSAESKKPPSLGARIASRWKPDRADRGEDPSGRRGQ